MGTMRFLLAMAVVVFHLLSIPKIGPIAVQAFFVLSGFLMTLVMHSSYGYGPSGFGRFWVNRVLRLYPIYIAFLVVSLPLVILFGPERDHAMDTALGVPATGLDWLQNIFLIFVDLDAPRLSPPAWALTTELFFYLLISLGLSANRWRSWAWFSASLAYMIWAVISGHDFYSLYFSVWGGALPFSVGALIYHYRQDLTRAFEAGFGSAGVTAGLIAAGSMGIIATTGGRALAALLDLPVQAEAAMLPLTALPAAALVFGCSRLKLSGWQHQVDRVLGDLSYPVYVSHFFFGMFAETLTGLYAPRHDLLTVETFILALLMMLPGCYLMTRLIDAPIQRMRDRVRGAKAEAGMSATGQAPHQI